MAQSAIRVSRELGISTPSIIGVWHSSTKENPWGRGKDLVPEKYFREGLEVHNDYAKIIESKGIKHALVRDSLTLHIGNLSFFKNETNEDRNSKMEEGYKKYLKKV